MGFAVLVGDFLEDGGEGVLLADSEISLGFGLARTGLLVTLKLIQLVFPNSRCFFKTYLLVFRIGAFGASVAGAGWAVVLSTTVPCCWACSRLRLRIAKSSSLLLKRKQVISLGSP